MVSIFLILLISYILLFIISIKIRDNSIVDVFWWVGFMMIAGISFVQSEKQLSQILVTWLVILWWIRIVSHIGFRKWKERKEDPRYAKWREEWGNGWYFYVRSFLQVYLLQMILLFIVATPILIVNSSWWHDVIGVPLYWFIFPPLGIFISLFWLIFEAISDLQLKEFIKIKKPWQIFISGLYKYSRHPNYFGESMFWLWISLISLPYSYTGIVGWIMITTLLLFVSWVPIQEARYAWREDWESYKNKTSVFVPWFPKK